MSKPTALISGASIAGPSCAFWLSRAGYRTTIVERAPALRRNGQQIDIRGLALTVTERTGLMREIRAKTTREQGVAFVDGRGKAFAAFGVGAAASASGGAQGLSSEIEILRGELAGVYYGATEGDTDYVFGDYITGIEEQAACARVTFSRGEPRDFDVVVLADGMRSSSRARLFSGCDPIRSLGQYTSFFTIPAVDPDMRWAQWYNATGGRCVFLRPDGLGNSTRAYLSKIGNEFRGYEKMTTQEQKDMMAALFADAGWITDRVLAGMQDCEDFYMQEIAQVKMEKWSKGRVVLLGDAAYCPSPISGMGTSSAIVGGYILAGELGRTKDHRVAFEQYEKLMRPYVDKAQSLPPGAPAIANPQTAWGISIFNTILSVVSLIANTRFGKWLTTFNGPGSEQLQLPEYDM